MIWVQTQYVLPVTLGLKRLTFHASTWAFYVPLFGTLINLGLLYWKRHSHPANLVLLSTFTLLEAFTLGIVVAFYDTRIVLQALFVHPPLFISIIPDSELSLITTGVFLGLTLFTLQSKVRSHYLILT